MLDSVIIYKKKKSLLLVLIATKSDISDENKELGENNNQKWGWGEIPQKGEAHPKNTVRRIIAEVPVEEPGLPLRPW